MSGFRRWLALMAVAMALALGGSVSVRAQAPIEGVWRTALKSEVTITACPDGFCGHLSHIVVPEGMLSGAEAEAAAAMDPAEFFDYRNKDPNLRDRPMLGLQILTLWQGREPYLYDGEIYNPEDGNSYSGYVEMVGPDTARLNGCVLFHVVCRGEEWTRVPLEELEARAQAEAVEAVAPAQ